MEQRKKYFAILARLRPGIKMASAYARPSVFLATPQLFVVLYYYAAFMFCSWTVLPFVCSWFVLERALMEIQVLGRRFAVDFASAACDVQVACAYYTLEKV